MTRKAESKTEPEAESSALVSKTESDGERQRKPWCKHCKKLWHTKHMCWKLHGKPLNFKTKNGGDSKVLQAVSENSQKQSINSKTPTFTKEQLSQLYKLFKPPQFLVNPSCSFAQNDNLLTVALHVKHQIHLVHELLILRPLTTWPAHHNYSHLIVHVQAIKRSRLPTDCYP